ncbi:MAG: MFS transporter [Acetobacterales bacterium]
MFSPLFLALLAMFFQQSFATTAKTVVPIVAPAALPDLGVSAAYVGIYVSMGAVVQIVSMMGCGNFIRRYGGLRISQAGLVLVLIGMACAASGHVWPFVLAAIFVVSGTSVATPASSQILSRYAPPRYAPLVFSAKQTAVPFGLVMGGVMIPAFVIWWGWQGALLAIGVLCAAFAVVLQPLRAEFDKDRDPNQPLSPKDFKSTFLGVMGHPALRRLAFAMFAFVGLQSTYTTYFVLTLTEGLGYSLTEAGGMFATATIVGMPARVVWGYVASRWMKPRHVLAALGLIMSAASAMTGLYGPDWTNLQILAVAALLTATALGWHGVLLAEIARLAPAGQVGTMTGGVLAFSGAGQAVMPLLFSALLAATGSYSYGFFVSAVPPLLLGLMLATVRSRPPAAGGVRE